MERIKREYNDTVHDYCGNKRQKLYNTNKLVIRILLYDLSLIPFRSVFEDLANEIYYEIFEYIDIYDVYQGFFDLNKRFRSILKDSNIPIQINISTMTKTKFECYYKKIMLPNKHRINYLRLSNPFTSDIVFSPPDIITQFIQLETLVLDNINQKSFNNISSELLLLPKLHSLIISFAGYIKSPHIPFAQIFRLSKLKSCKLSYQEKRGVQFLPIQVTEHDRSPIEYLVIKCGFSLQSMSNLLSCLPQLRHLSIDSLGDSSYGEMETENKERIIELNHLKYVSLRLRIEFDLFEDLIKNYFRSIEVLRLTTTFHSEYLEAKKWEQLITSYMPNLRIFDIDHHGYGEGVKPSSFHDSINQFNSSFWISKQWFFTHQHDWKENPNHGIFYSTNPYR